MFQRPLFWLLCLSLWLALLIWRLVDFLDEEHRSDYHVTRVGLNIGGGYAEILQLALIALCALFSGYCLWRLWRTRGPHRHKHLSIRRSLRSPR